jgi:type II secretory pathway predicted ATPase ExeA
MYETHFGFTEKPFELTPDPAFLFLSAETKEIIATLKFCILEKRGFLLLIGEPGTGKTTLINTLMDWSDEKTEFAYVFNPAFDFHDLLQTVLSEFGLAKENGTLSKRKAIKKLNDYAIKRYEEDKNTVIIVDEAQYLNIETLENLRLLSNLETRKHKLIQIIIAGQPELELTLSSPKLRQLTQRISLRRKTKALDEKECSDYIRHRLEVAGYTGPQIFANRARHIIFEYCKGIPRKINILCDSALLIAFATKKSEIDSSIVKEAIEDLQTVSVDISESVEKNLKHKIYANDTLASTGKMQSQMVEEQFIQQSNQEIEPLIASKSSKNVKAGKESIKSEFKGREQKVNFPKRWIAILATIFFLNSALILFTGFTIFYFWGKNRYNPESHSKASRSEDSSMTLKSDVENSSKVKETYTSQINLDDKLQDLYNKMEKIKITLEENLKKKNEHQNMTSQVESEPIFYESIAEDNLDLISGSKVKTADTSKYIVVRKGESLYEIIIREYGKFDEGLVSLILKRNPEIISPDIIEENQVIILPETANTKLRYGD